MNICPLLPQELIANLRRQSEMLNDYQFSNMEWEQFFKSKIANQNNGIEEKTTIIQEVHIQLLFLNNYKTYLQSEAEAISESSPNKTV